MADIVTELKNRNGDRLLPIVEAFLNDSIDTSAIANNSISAAKILTNSIISGNISLNVSNVNCTITRLNDSTSATMPALDIDLGGDIHILCSPFYSGLRSSSGAGTVPYSIQFPYTFSELYGGTAKISEEGRPTSQMTYARFETNSINIWCYVTGANAPIECLFMVIGKK